MPHSLLFVHLPEMFFRQVSGYFFRISLFIRKNELNGSKLNNTIKKMKKIINYFPVVLLVAFALLTLFLSSSVLFDWFGIREKEGNYVLFVVWANFVSSLLYLFAAYGFLKRMKMTFNILSLSALILIMAFVGLFIHINSGGLYETKTIGAMIFRISITLAFVVLAYFKFIRNEKNN